MQSTVVGDSKLLPAAARLDDTAGGTVLYYGIARVGASEAEAVWQIQRITFPTVGEDDTVIEWADGDILFDNVWDDRGSLTYA